MGREQTDEGQAQSQTVQKTPAFQNHSKSWPALTANDAHTDFQENKPTGSTATQKLF